MRQTVRVDAHQHFWQPLRGDYGWMPKDDPVLSRAYHPAELAPQMASCGMERTVLVQAAPTIEETEYMLGLADATPFVAGVVGWIDFEDRSHLKHLERLKRHPKFLGVRPMIQDIPDTDWMLRPDIQWAFEALIDLDLTFDALGFSRHLDNFRTILTRYGRLRAVIDHCMKPQIRDHGTAKDEFLSWSEGMRRLARETNACCKLSGLVTEAGARWTVGDLRPYAGLVIEAFGPRRVMWGSDWPVSRLRGEYGDWHAAAQALCADLGDDGRAAIFGDTAARFYRLE